MNTVTTIEHLLIARRLIERLLKSSRRAIARCALLTTVILMSACSQYYFYPMRDLVRTPAELGLQYEDLTFTTRDQLKLHGWLLHADTTHSPQRGIVLFLHGNAENISTHIGSVYWLPEQGYDVVMLDYRGFGRSEGVADFPQVYDDADAAYRWLQDYARQKQAQGQPQPVFILAQSIGAAIGSYYFSQLPRNQIIFNAVALDAVFSGHRDIAKDALRRSIITWPFQLIVPLLVPTEYDPKAHIAQLAPTPLLFLHSPEDAIIPYHQGETVFRHAREPKEWVSTRGPHIATFNYSEYRKILLEFFARNSSRNSAPNSALNPSAPPQTD